MKPERWQEIERLFNATLEQKPEKRAAFLAEACAGDESIRKEVERLLALKSEAEGFIEKPAIEMAAKEMAEAEATANLSGESFLHYRILEKIGAGGMGEVYRARDDRLKRDVAIKVLPDIFTKDPERLARFDREATLLASLNHPNIAAIHGLEQADGKRFIVMELIEGETPADQLKRGPISIEESLKLGLQIAEALEAAHEKGVIHRDLKPANIKVTSEGKVKVLDFGLAKAFAGEQAGVSLSNSPTISEIATQQGVILGTAAYMSPEQARGKPVDKRADIWAFGCVLYEMLTGHAAFSGKDVADILASVIRSEPDWSRLPANLHWRIKELLERCLVKEARDRCGAISDARVEIQKALADSRGVLIQSAIDIAPAKKLRMMLPWMAVAVILAAIISGIAVWKLKPISSSEPLKVRFDYELPEGQEFGGLDYLNLAVSPDGKQIIYATTKGFYLRSLDELTAKLISETEEHPSNPFFSPDGKWVGYASNFKLKKIAINGGAPWDLCDYSNVARGGWWDEHNMITYGQYGQDIMQISADGGSPKSIVKLKSGSLYYPQILPDGKSILYTSYPPKNAQPKIMVQSPKSGEAKELFPGVNARYVPSGHIIYMLPNKNSLFAVQFDIAGLQVISEPVTVLERVLQYAVSASGTLAYMPVTSSPASAKRTLVWVNRKGEEEPLSAPPNIYSDIRISPDGKRVALMANTPKANIWIWDLVGKTQMRLTSDEGAGSTSPLWTPDGKRILYAWDRENLLLGGVYWKASDGTGGAEKLASSPGRGLMPWSFSKDGKSLVLWEVTPSPFHWDIGVLSVEGNHQRKELLHDEKYLVKEPRISPDGRWLAYASTETKQSEIWVCGFPDVKKGKWQVSTSGGNHPLWSPDGKELFFNNGDATMAVPVETDPQFKINGLPKVLFRGTLGKVLGPSAGLAGYTYWDISPDGKRFLMLKDDPVQAPRKINIVVNWFEELKQRVPVK
jgi:eukaryotic-like serine/threonine-protein kinase